MEEAAVVVPAADVEVERRETGEAVDGVDSERRSSARRKRGWTIPGSRLCILRSSLASVFQTSYSMSEPSSLRGRRRVSLAMWKSLSEEIRQAYV